MKILLTGATGFIGNHLCHKLVERGHSIVALLRSANKRHLLPDGVDVLKGDLSIFSNEKPAWLQVSR